MNKNAKRNFSTLVFLVTVPFLGLACASSEKKMDAPTVAAHPMVDTPKQSAEMPKTSSTPVVASKKTTAARMICELNGDKRTVILREKGAGCEVIYTKFGQKRVAGESPEGNDRCDNVFDRFKKNLSDAGFACRETD